MLNVDKSLMAEIDKAYKGLVSSLDSDLRKVAEPYLFDRDFSNNRVLGIAHLPLMVAEGFGIIDQNLIRQASLATICFDHYAQLIDDVKDNPTLDSAISMHAANSLLLKGMSICQDIINNPKEFTRKISEYFDQASNGERYFWKRSRKIRPYDENDFRMLSQRGAVAKTPIAIYSNITGESNVQQFEKAVDLTVTGIQIFDDLLDWESDLKSKVYTHAISCAYQKTKSLTPESVVRGLFYENGVDRVLAEGRKYILDGANLFRKVGCFSAEESIKEGITRIESSIRSVERRAKQRSKIPNWFALNVWPELRMQLTGAVYTH